METLLWGLLGYGVLPIWLLAGLADYLTHARTRLAQTSGVRESALHLLQTAEIGVPMLALLFLQVTALTLALMIFGALAHTVTAYRDIRYAAPLRRISTFEQFAHAFLIALPLAALGIVIVLHWPAFTALLAMGDASRDAWALRWREPPFDVGVIVAILGASFVLGILPGLLEFINAWRHGRRGAPSA
ncbi:MAG: hypothetical protein ACREPE_08005 [Lysobacter sp.]